MKCGDRVSLLNIGVKGVVKNTDSICPDQLGIGDRLLARVEEVRLEAVLRLEPCSNPGLAE